MLVLSKLNRDISSHLLDFWQPVIDFVSIKPKQNTVRGVASVR